MTAIRCGFSARGLTARAIAVLCFGALLGAWTPAPAGAQAPPPKDVDAATFDKLVGELESNEFYVRERATKELTGYVNPASAKRLTLAQLQSLRTLARSKPLETARRAGDVLRTWANKNPDTLGPAQALLTGIQVKPGDYDGFLNEGDFRVGAFKVAYQGSGGQVLSDLMKPFVEAQGQLGAGFTDKVVDNVKAMKKVIDDLKDADLKNLYITKGGVEMKKADLSKALDDAVKDAEKLMKKVGESIGDPPPAAAPKMNVPGMGAIDVGKTFRLALAGPGLTSDSLTFAMLPGELAASTPPVGKALFGYVLDLAADGGLRLQPGSTVTVGIEYGTGLPGWLASQLTLQHLADGRYVPFDQILNDPGAGVISGRYLVPSASSGLDQFGEFALVTPAPEPSAVLLLLPGVAALLVVGRRRLSAAA
jgi:hypothetical protein